MVPVRVEELQGDEHAEVGAAARLRDSEGFGAHGGDARLRAARTDRPQGARPARLDVRHQDSRRTLLPDAQPQPTAAGARSVSRCSCSTRLLDYWLFAAAHELN